MKTGQFFFIIFFISSFRTVKSLDLQLAIFWCVGYHPLLLSQGPMRRTATETLEIHLFYQESENSFFFSKTTTLMNPTKRKQKAELIPEKVIVPPQYAVPVLELCGVSDGRPIDQSPAARKKIRLPYSSCVTDFLHRTKQNTHTVTTRHVQFI